MSAMKEVYLAALETQEHQHNLDAIAETVGMSDEQRERFMDIANRLHTQR